MKNILKNDRYHVSFFFFKKTNFIQVIDVEFCIFLIKKT
jgi:hypothetical protein